MSEESSRLDIARDYIQPGLLALFFFIIVLQLSGMALETHVNESYVTFYWRYAVICLIAAGMMVAFNWRYGDLFGLPTWFKSILVVGFVVFIASISFSGGQVIGVPRASAVDFQLSPETEIYTSSVIPAFLEDFTHLWALPMIMIVAVVMIFDMGFGIELSRGHLMIIAVIACLIASMGYNHWVLPGFTSAHIPTYGNNQIAYQGAFVFSFGQSMVYVATGWFLPIAHGIHNFIIQQSRTAGYSIGGFSLT